jgi:hypothetical protein
LIRTRPLDAERRVSARRAQLSAGKFRAKEYDMLDSRSRTAKASLVPAALILFAAFTLSACVQSYQNAVSKLGQSEGR